MPALFDLNRANAILPQVQKLTTEAVAKADELATQAMQLAESDPKRREIQDKFRRVVEYWADAVTGLGAVVKGLWLVDFDHGDGYYCWKHPEPSLEFHHSYDGGYSTRVPIEPPILH